MDSSTGTSDPNLGGTTLGSAPYVSVHARKGSKGPSISGICKCDPRRLRKGDFASFTGTFKCEEAATLYAQNEFVARADLLINVHCALARCNGGGPITCFPCEIANVVIWRSRR